MTGLDVGLDLGSTWVKALAATPEGEQVAVVRRRTPWTSLPSGCTQTTADALAATVRELLSELDGALAGSSVQSIGISGMAEAGVLLDEVGQAHAPIPAWFDPRGEQELLAVSPALLDELPSVTGLPVSALCTLAKLLHHRANGLDLAGLTWLNVPEYVAHLLGGDRAGEVSLTARTGLVDQDHGEPWAPAFEALGVGTELLPQRRTAGSVWGTAAGVPASMRGAVLTVAGHDHLVASVAAGVVAPRQLYDSMGTAEALVRVLERPLPRERRGALAALGVNTVRHLLPGRSTMLAGTRTGLVLRRVLGMVGVTDAEGRDVLDAAVLALPSGQQHGGRVSGIEVRGAVNTSSTLTVRVDNDDVSPALLFAAALAHCDEVLADVVALLDAEIGPADETVVSGGWSGMATIRRARRALLPGVRFSTRSEDTAHGAALIGAFAASTENDLADFASRRVAAATRSPGPKPLTPTTGRKPRMTTTPVQPSSLDAIATDAGTFAVVAMDQRNTLKRMFAAAGIADPTTEEMTAIKADVVEALGSAASAFLLDPTYGVPALDRVSDEVRKQLGVLVAAEPSERRKYQGEPRGTYDASLDAAWVRAQGGDALKFLIQLRADRPGGSGPDLAAESVEVIRTVVEDCRAAGMPSVIENLIYPLPGEELTPQAREDAIIAAAVALDALQPDLLKLEYPGSAAGCRRLAAAISSPWAVLSAGVDFEEFTEVLKVSCDEGGASGFIAGRAVWKETVGMGEAARRAYLADEGRRRLVGCLEAIDGRAVPWRKAAGI